MTHSIVIRTTNGNSSSYTGITPKAVSRISDAIKVGRMVVFQHSSKHEKEAVMMYLNCRLVISMNVYTQK